MKMTREYKTLTKYTDLSDFVITFDPLTHSDKRWKQIFEDQYARVIFAGYRINHLVGDELDILMEEALNVGNEIRSGKLQLEHEPLKNRLKEMFIKFCLVNPLIRQAIDNDINNEFTRYLFPYLKGEKSFRYKVKQKKKGFD